MPLTKVTPNNLHQTVKTMVQTMVDENSTDSAQVTLIVNSNIAAKSTDDISEGSNLYHTTARARSSISATGSLSYNSSTGIMSFTQGNTDTISEGSSNLYYTDERVDDRVGALVVGGNNITATYNDTAGTLTIDGQPGYADSDVGSYLSANGYGTSSSIIGTITASAPSTLDTLNELAAALGDDANFSTTVTNSIATKLPLAGGTITGDVTFADNAKATFGTGSDLEIYHDGTYSYIKDDTSSQMRFQNGDFQFYSANGFQNIAKFHETSGVDLYYQNSKKFETSSTGIDVTGNIVVSGTVDGRDVATDGTKLDGIETNADVTDATNVTAAGALMDTEVTNLAQVKAFDSTDYATAAQGTTADNALPKAGGTITGDVVFSGTNHSGVTWDTSEDEFLFAEGSRIDFGGGANIRRESDGILRITGATADDTYFNFSNNLIFYRGGSAAAQMMIAGSTQRFHAYGNITVGGTVDGRDVATDGTKLDGIESGATADQTKADIEGLGIDVPATNLTGTIPAARLSTATTQAESDDSTKIATTAYVTDKITTLIGGAPSTLNDLNELAAAINDDANYNSTLTTALATKLPKAGGTMTGNVTFGDSNKVIFGAGSDASIFSDGTSGYARGFILQNTSGNQDVLTFAEGGATTLFHNNASKIATTSSGIDVTGNIVVSGTVDGRDVATDGTKLDGIESGATADQTAAQLLTAVKTVDGSGSGLDADLLDGVQGSSYMRSTGMANNADTYMNFRVMQNNNSSNLNDGMYIGYQNSNSGTTRVFGGGAGSGGIHITGSGANDIKYNNSSVFWHAGNDGSGSGLDADTVDGIQGSSFLRSDADDTTSGIIVFGPNPGWSKYLKIGGNANNSDANSGSIGVTNGNLHLDAANGAFATYLNFYDGTGGVAFGNGGGSGAVAWMGPDGDLWKGGADNTGSKYWHAGNDGSGSGLDADTVDGIQGSSFLRSDTSDTMNGSLTVESTGQLNVRYDSSDNYRSTLDWNYLQLGNNGGNSIVAGRTSTGGYLRFFVNNSSDVSSSINGTEAMRIHNSARISMGAGFTGTTGWLNVSSGSAYPLYLQSTQRYMLGLRNTSVDANYIWLTHDTRNSQSSMAIHFNGTADRFFFEENGDFTAAGDVVANSDVRLKSNINTINNALDKVLNLRGVEFTKHSEDNKVKHIGVIAQEVESVVPEVVTTADDEDNTKSVAYGNMVALLIEAIKEQQEQIDMLKEKLESK